MLVSSETHRHTEGLMHARRRAKITIQGPWSIIIVRCKRCFLPAKGKEIAEYTQHWKKEEEYRRERETAHWLLIKGTEMQEGKKPWKRGETKLMSEIGLGVGG